MAVTNEKLKGILFVEAVVIGLFQWSKFKLNWKKLSIKKIHFVIEHTYVKQSQKKYRHTVFLNHLQILQRKTSC